MNLLLERIGVGPYGARGWLSSDDGTLSLATLEHTYSPGETVGESLPSGSQMWVVKLPGGTYTCRRGVHRLHSSAAPIEAFEVTGVPGHDGILLHVGNTAADSDGCVLIGCGAAGFQLLNSRAGFQQLMSHLAGVDEFTLTVENHLEIDA